MIATNSQQPLMTILIVDDSESDRAIYSRYLQSDKTSNYQILEAETLGRGKALWCLESPDLVFVDLNLPDGNGLELLAAMRKDDTDLFLPAIVLTGQGNERVAIQSIRLGVTDYLVKSDINAALLCKSARKAISRIVIHRLQQESLKASHSVNMQRDWRNDEVEKSNCELQIALEELRSTEEDLREKQTQLLSEQDRYRFLFDFAPAGYLVTDADGKIMEANQAISNLLACRPEYLVGKPLIVFVLQQEMSRFYSQLKYLLIEPQVKTWEMILRSRQGKTFPVEVTANYSNDAATQEIQIRWFMRDISDRKQAEELIRQQLQQEQELSRLQRNFFSMISHEFRTPLGVIKMSAQLIEHNCKQMLDEKIRRNLARIQSSISYITSLLDDMITIDRAEASQLEVNPQVINVVDFCQNLVDELQLENPPRIAIVTQSVQNHKAYFDPKILRFILSNLLSNAIKYSEPTAQIDLEVDHSKNALVFRIQDRGMGIPLEEQTHIFEPFYRATNADAIAGSGLGLAVVKKCAKVHGGTVTFTSKVGVGTIFVVTIPSQLPLLDL